MIKNQKIGINQKQLLIQMQKNQQIGMMKKMENGKHQQFQIQIIKVNGHLK